MKINSKIHGILDYVSVLLLWVSPTLFELPEITSRLTYIIGCVHLILTILTNFELGLIKIIALKVHSIIEIIVAISLVPIAFYLESIENNTDARNFYLIFAIVLASLWFLTDYKKKSSN